MAAESGPSIFSRGVRGAIVSFLRRYHVGSRELWMQFVEREGFGDFDDFMRHVRKRDGDAVADSVGEAFTEEMRKSPNFQAFATPALRNMSFDSEVGLWALLAMPDADFLVALQHAMTLFAIEWEKTANDVSPSDPRAAFVGFLNELFAKRGVPYRATSQGELERTGDPELEAQTVVPALEVLADPRLSGALSEFEDALVKLAAGQPKDLEDAVDEANKGVESTMKVVLDERNIPRKGTEPAAALFKLVQDADVPAYMDNLVLAVSRIRNRDASHGAGSQPRRLPRETSTAAVHAAAIAISYLATKLPP